MNESSDEISEGEMLPFANTYGDVDKAVRPQRYDPRHPIAPIPLDVVLNEANPKLRFINVSNEVERADQRPDQIKRIKAYDPDDEYEYEYDADDDDKDCPRYDGDLIVYLMKRYMLTAGMGHIVNYVNVNQKIIRSKVSSSNWQVNSIGNRRPIESLFDMHDFPVVQRPTVLYRGYRSGMGTMPQIGDEIDFGVRSAALSLGFVVGFATGKNPESFVARIDIMPGVKILPLFNYPDKVIATEFECIVDGRSDGNQCIVHDPTEVIEGTANMLGPPFEFSGYKYPDSKYKFIHRNLPKIKLYLVISPRGSQFAYNPNYHAKPSKSRLRSRTRRAFRKRASALPISTGHKTPRRETY